MTTRPGGSSIPPSERDDPTHYVGRILNGRYRLNELITTGGMGMVFRAGHMQISKDVAIKILRPSMADNADHVKRFQQEIEVLSRLSHPNIVAVTDSGRDAGGAMYFVMDFVEGETFLDALGNGDLSLSDILNVLEQICRALSEAHNHDIIHRDLKTENVMVSRLTNGQLHARILDFGVAKSLGSIQSLTRAGEVPGTPEVIAPELVETNTPSAQSDLYSFGVMMFTALTGYPPFEGVNEFELMRAHQTQPVPNLREIVPDVPESIVELVLELLQKDPTLRPESAEKVRLKLTSFIQSIDATDGHKPSTRETIEKNTDAAQTAETVIGTIDSDGKISPSSIISFLIVVLMVIVVILIYFVFKTMVLKT